MLSLKEEITQIQDNIVRLLLHQVPSFKLCKCCKIEAYAVKRDPRYAGAGWCPRTYDGHHVWFEYEDMPDDKGAVLDFNEGVI